MTTAALDSPRRQFSGVPLAAGLVGIACAAALPAGWVPIAFALLVAGVWLQPFALSVALVYLHPLMALWLLDRELRRSHPAWRPAYHAGLLVVPLLMGVLYWRLYDAAPLPGDDPVSVAIQQHAG